MLKALTYTADKPCHQGHWTRYVKSNQCVECMKINTKRWRLREKLDREAEAEARNPDPREGYF